MTEKEFAERSQREEFDDVIQLVPAGTPGIPAGTPGVPAVSHHRLLRKFEYPNLYRVDVSRFPISQPLVNTHLDLGGFWGRSTKLPTVSDF